MVIITEKLMNDIRDFCRDYNAKISIEFNVILPAIHSIEFNLSNDSLMKFEQIIPREKWGSTTQIAMPSLIKQSVDRSIKIGFLN